MAEYQSDNCLSAGQSKSGRAEPQPNAPKMPPGYTGKGPMSGGGGSQYPAPNPPGGKNFQS